MSLALKLEAAVTSERFEVTVPVQVGSRTIALICYDINKPRRHLVYPVIDFFFQIPCMIA